MSSFDIKLDDLNKRAMEILEGVDYEEGLSENDFQLVLLMNVFQTNKLLAKIASDCKNEISEGMRKISNNFDPHFNNFMKR